MDSLDVLWMIVSPSPSHPFGLDVVGHNLVVIRKGCVADRAFAILLDDFSVQQLSHLGWRPSRFPGAMLGSFAIWRLTCRLLLSLRLRACLILP